MSLGPSLQLKMTKDKIGYPAWLADGSQVDQYYSSVHSSAHVHSRSLAEDAVLPAAGDKEGPALRQYAQPHPVREGRRLLQTCHSHHRPKRHLGQGHMGCRSGLFQPSTRGMLAQLAAANVVRAGVERDVHPGGASPAARVRPRRPRLPQLRHRRERHQRASRDGRQPLRSPLLCPHHSALLSLPLEREGANWDEAGYRHYWWNKETWHNWLAQVERCNYNLFVNQTYCYDAGTRLCGVQNHIPCHSLRRTRNGVRLESGPHHLRLLQHLRRRVHGQHIQSHRLLLGPNYQGLLQPLS